MKLFDDGAPRRWGHASMGLHADGLHVGQAVRRCGCLSQGHRSEGADLWEPNPRKPSLGGPFVEVMPRETNRWGVDPKVSIRGGRSKVTARRAPSRRGRAGGPNCGRRAEGVESRASSRGGCQADGAEPRRPSREGRAERAEPRGPSREGRAESTEPRGPIRRVD